MQKFGLVCEKKNTKGGERIFYVLSRLRPGCVKISPTDYGKRAVSVFHDFGGYLPDDLFQRGVTRFIEKFQVEDCEPTLSYEHVELHIDQLHQVVLNVATIKHRRMFKTTIIRRNILNPTQLTKEKEPSPTVCKKVLSFLEIELKIFCTSDARGIELTRYIACECSDATHMHIVRKFDKDVLPCGSNGMEVTRYRRLFGDEPLYRRLLMKFKSIRKGLLQYLQAVNNPKGFVDDATIATVSENFNFSWRRFGVRLGHNWSEVNEFSADHTQTIEEAVENMMIYWRSSCSSDIHQRKVLCTALKLHGFSSLAYQLFEGEVGDETLVTQQAGECFNDQDLLFICDKLDSGSWRRLGVRLGCKWTSINNIANNNRKVEDCMMELLVTWRDEQSKSQQVPTMVNALKQQQLVELAQSVCERHGYSDEAEAAPKITLPQIPTPVQGKCFSDQDLLFICDNLESGSWRRLGVHLGLKWSSINKIANNYKQVEDRIMELLVTWRSEQSKSQQVPTMVNALRQQQLVGLAESVCERHGHSDESEVAITRINLPQIPTQVQGCLDDIDMVYISDKLDSKYLTYFGVYLGMEKHEIDRIESDFSPPVVDACIEMLVRWRSRQKAEVNHLKAISEALNKFERIDIKEELESYYQKKYGKIEAKV